METKNIRESDAAGFEAGLGVNWVDIGTIHDIPLRGARCVRTPQGRIAVFRTADDQVFAMEDRCPHKAGPLSQGIVHGTSVTCPLHNMVISLETGQAQGADEGEVRTIPIRNRDGLLSIAVDTLSLLVAAE
ncbi:assimilatory nitrite reductase (NAD(P)H) small subunit [Rhizobium sp. PP-F2F-G38]|nr:assimilatory nitrite reductase (NAD(P)H) small subunit [Rhizobium sp. PP-WC-1G-195]PYE98412.1 assimilatory nitrite reductase (NAD(P)H) small subunit [Rhizobium sp. PP-F2F-G38]TCP89237.1 assimilatory nitrite reductase (NAD(P)H) small subunit [Rhizobium sp. PP-CC-2G-626]TCQ11895.1 assimilatory nitrite reductase (NAD(P)H) small subunit [Rhizobium sp. PP-F2F-G36]